MGKAAMATRKKKERALLVEQIKRDKAAMKWRPEKTFDTAEKEVDKRREQHKLAEPKRSDYKKGRIGDIKFKVAYREWLEKTL